MIAIVIPYYKISFFEETLQSLANQTVKRFKVYIGDDASPENPMLLLQKYRDKINYSYVRFDSNLGGISLVRQWNRCISMVESEKWIQILGDDDVLSSNFIETFYNNLEEIKKLDINVVKYASCRIDFNGKNISQLYKHPKIESSIDFFFRRLNGKTRSSLSEFIFNLVSLKTIGFKEFPYAWQTDVLAFLEFSNFKNIFTLNNSVVYVRSSFNNISSREDLYIQKNTATFLFYYYLIDKKFNQFNITQQLVLLNKFEKTIFNNKLNLYLWSKLILLYFKKFKFKRLFKLVLKIFNVLISKYVL